jgi:hypothetical protein
MRSLLPLLSLLLCTYTSSGQGNRTLPLYADHQAGDSIEKVISLIYSELNRSVPVQFKESPLSAYSGTGLVLATTQQAAKNKLNYAVQLRNMGPEAFSITGSGETVSIISNSALGLKGAVYTYLEQLGYRWLMPGDLWKIVPSAIKSPYIRINLITQPDYEGRSIANGHAYMNSVKIANDFNSWAESNKLGGAFSVRTGHSYDEIVSRNTESFKQHPEYFARPPAKGNLPPGEFKFNVANKDLVDLVVKDAIARYEMQQVIKDYTPMVSMEPSDGGGYCLSGECTRIGSPSDQAFYLTNAAARGIRKKYPGVWVGTYAYNEHILPTKYELEPNVFVMITNGFNRSQFTTDELMRLWGKKASKIGVYEYLSVYEWDHELPGQMQAAQTDYLAESVRRFYLNGARAYVGESVMGWVSRGPGQYLLSKLLWNTKLNVDSVRDDFFQKAYENTAPLISRLYRLWEHYPHRIIPDNDLSEWFEIANEAYKAARSETVRKRIDHVKMYLNYLAMYRDLRKKPSDANLMRVMTYAFRSFETTAFATLPVMVSLPNYSGFPGKGWYDNPNQPWKNDSRPYTDAELQQTFQAYLKSFKKIEGLKPFAKADDFIKLSDITSTTKKNYYVVPHAVWDRTEYVFGIKSQSANNYLELKSDLSAQPPIDRPVMVIIYPMQAGKAISGKETPVLKIGQRKKNEFEKFSLASLKPGTYRMVIEDERKMFVLNFSESIDYSTYVGPKYKINTTSAAGLNWYYFYVPAGVKKFQVMKTTAFELETPSGRKIKREDVIDGEFEVDVLPGEEGIWTIGWQAGSFYLEGVPPYIGDNPSRMLVPSYLKK